LTKFLIDLRDIDTLQEHYRAMEAAAQRTSNKADATSKRKHRIISSQDETGKQAGEKTKRNRKHRRSIHNNVRNVKRSKTHPELSNYTNTSYLQGTVIDGIQEYLTRLSNYKD
jgi:hypothetical protein